MMAHDHFKHATDNSILLTPEDWPRIDETVDWSVEKNRSGYKMVNSVRRLEEMKAVVRGRLQDWNCRAGQNSLII